MTAGARTNDPLATQEARDWIMRLASGDITEAEMAAYHRWASVPLHKAIFAHELALWRSLDAVGDRLAPSEPAPEFQSEPAAKVTELPPPRIPLAPRIPLIRRMAQAGMAAAVIALFLAGPEAMLRLQADYRTDLATRSLTLPDGSRAVLDADSAIAVEYSGSERRIALLRGRVWFDVAHGNPRPFRVAAAGALVEDVGTAFEVSSGAGRASAAVTQGIVRVGSSGAAPDWLQLTVGQRASWADGGAPVRDGDIPAGRIAAWRGGEILLDGVGVRVAIAEIARYRRGPTYVLGAVDGLLPVTAITRTARAEEALDAVADTAGLAITRLPGGIAILRPTK